MRDTMQYELPPHALDVWERTLLPTTSSRIKRSLNGKPGEISFASRLSEVGGTGYHVTRLPGGETAIIELSSSPSEESWNSLRDTPTSSLETLCPYSISVLMEQPQRLARILEETTDESTSDEWQQTRSTSASSQARTGFGSSPQISSWIASTIRRITNSLLDSGK